ncbi:electron transport complex subunit RsxC [Sesbania bispinosa]|nr:electron transport complex subunit RsxC [Sesbania bispinosa]
MGSGYLYFDAPINSAVITEMGYKCSSCSNGWWANGGPVMARVATVLGGEDQLQRVGGGGGGLGGSVVNEET